MHGHAFGYANADRCDLAIRSVRVGRNPDAASALHLGAGDAEFRADVDEQGLDSTHVGDDVDGIG